MKEDRFVKDGTKSFRCIALVSSVNSSHDVVK